MARQQPNGNLDVPPLLGSGWHYLNPEGDDDRAAAMEAVVTQTEERQAVMARAFSTPEAREALAILRHIAQHMPRFVPGMSGDQAMAAILYRDAKLDLLDFIDEEVRKALES